MINPPKLWVWNGSPDDKLDVMRYVSATKSDVLRQPIVVIAMAKLEAELTASEAEVERDKKEIKRLFERISWWERRWNAEVSRAESAESLCTTFENALKAIATAGTSMPAVDNDEVGHYRSVAYSLIGIASDALLERGKL